LPAFRKVVDRVVNRFKYADFNSIHSKALGVQFDPIKPVAISAYPQNYRTIFRFCVKRFVRIFGTTEILELDGESPCRHVNPTAYCLGYVIG